jgi:hypothetical protein
MNTKLHPIFATLALLACVHQVAAQGTAFTYQGRLNSGGSPAKRPVRFPVQTVC